MLKIAIVGPESTAKSEITKSLAEHFNAYFVEEIARAYLANLTNPYNAEDIENIAKAQWQEELRILDNSNSDSKTVQFADTNALVTKIWFENFTNKKSELINELWEMQKNYYQFHLLMDIDIPWQPDPLREHPHKRKYFFNIYKQELQEALIPFAVVSGIGKERINNALEILKHNLNI